jgi:transcriptional regulator with PAS, ATPase and Fis domain
MHAISTEEDSEIEVTPTWRAMIVGSSSPIQRLIEMISIMAARRTTVLLTGETGVGKEVVARAIHAASPRANKAFIPVNCAAIPRDLLEAELFGQVDGVFSASTVARTGCFERADGGTLLLDEIGDIALNLQGKLLRVLQEREFQPVGSSKTLKSDVRVIASTNVDLLSRMKQGKFREDLYYRLHVVPLQIPPLRDRLSDIPLLVTHFIHKIALQEGLPTKTLQADVLQHLLGYSWPGNVRELENSIEMAMVVSGERTTLALSDFSLPNDAHQTIEMTEEHLIKLPEHGIDFEAAMARIEFDLLEQAMRRSNGNKRIAADLLRLKRTTLAAKLKTLEGVFPDLVSNDSDVY